MKFDKGFTLIELLIALIIIGILAGLGLRQFQNARQRSTDSERKQALESVVRALEMYYNDHSRYPPENELVFDGESSLDDASGTVYMKRLPQDPVAGCQYIYETDNKGSYYRLYADLANQQDNNYGTYAPDCGGGGNSCHYCLASSNVSCGP